LEIDTKREDREKRASKAVEFGAVGKTHVVRKTSDRSLAKKT
jgi:hypothetical protein